MATVQVRCIVRDVDAAIAFYVEQLGFALVMHPAPPPGGVGVRQVPAEDPSGNPVEPFEPLRAGAALETPGAA